MKRSKTKKKMLIEHGCIQIHSDAERLGLGFGGRKEDNKEVPIVRDARECYEFDEFKRFDKCFGWDYRRHDTFSRVLDRFVYGMLCIGGDCHV